MSNTDINPSSSGVFLRDIDKVPKLDDITLANVLKGPSNVKDTDIIDSGAKRPSRSPVVAAAVRQLVGEEEIGKDDPIVVGAHADVQRYNRKGDPEPKTYTAKAKSLAPGAAIGATAGTGISLLVDAASKKGLSVRRALLAAMMGAPAGALLQLAYQGVTKDREESISSSRLPSAVQGYIDFGKIS
jgi:hypothetical protein